MILQYGGNLVGSQDMVLLSCDPLNSSTESKQMINGFSLWHGSIALSCEQSMGQCH